MKNIQKNALKIMVLIALFTTAAFADGDMPGGGLANTGSVPNDTTVITRTTDDNGVDQTLVTSDAGSIVRAIMQYLDLMI